MTTYIGLLAVALILACVAGYLRVTLGSKPQRPGARPIDPAGGFASGHQLREHLSADTVRRKGAQVRPSLPIQRSETKRKGLLRGRR